MAKKKGRGGARPAVRDDDRRLTDDPKRTIAVSLRGTLIDRLDKLDGSRSANVEALLIEALDAREKKAARAKAREKRPKG